MIPFYFGKPEKSLFGILHTPAQNHGRRSAIIICQPFGKEYILGYRALRQLALQLTRVGFSVLRFDYYGCGNSAGESYEGNLSQWLTDTETAIQEMKSRGALSKVHLIGARIGAAVALQAGTRRSDVDAVVLWDPVVNGKDYLANLTSQHNKWLTDHSTPAAKEGAQDKMLQVLGFPISPVLEENLNQLDLREIKPGITRRPALTVETDATTSGKQLSNCLEGVGWAAEYRHISGPRIWQRATEYDNAVVPQQALQEIVDWASRIMT